MMKKRVWFISQFGDPEHYDMTVYQSCPKGDDEIHWIKLQLEELGVLDQIDYQGVRVDRGDDLPDINDVDAAFLGGSYHSVHDGFEWQSKLQNWLAAYHKANKPLFGICGGHQQIATFLGSNVGTIETGVMAGSLPVDLTDAGKEHFLYKDIPDEGLNFHFGNYEHVETAPAGATVLATRPEMPAMAIDYGNSWYSVQYHPEATREMFHASWSKSDPTKCDNYYELPHAPKMLKNFIENI